MKHSAEFFRCLVDLDVAGARKLWAHVMPGLAQFGSDREMLTVLHLARVESKRVPKHLKAYSRRWLKEHETGRVAMAVGISIKASPRRMHQAVAIREAMEGAVLASVKAGVDLDEDAAEVRRRIMIARDKEWRGGK